MPEFRYILTNEFAMIYRLLRIFNIFRNDLQKTSNCQFPTATKSKRS